MSAEFLGLDLHKVFSGAEGDIGTLTLQGYLMRIDNMADHPPFLEDEDDWGFEYRIFNFNYTALLPGIMNVRVGHFEIPFGLEQVINTNGTLRDYDHGRNLGLKADWGATLNGDLPLFEYEVGLSRGSGNDWEAHGNPYVFAGRIGTPREHALVVGLSGFQGDVVDESRPARTVRRKRAGFDVQAYWHRLGLMADASTGADDGREVRNLLLELDYSSPDDAWMLYTQLRRLTLERIAGTRDDASSVSLGTAFDLGRHWSISAQWTRELREIDGRSGANAFFAQLRWRY
jgi:hypothetical protein